MIKQNFREIFESLGLVDIKSLDKSIIADLRYATDNNFTGEILYTEDIGIYAEPGLANAVVKTNSLLHKIYPDYNIVIFDAARPMSVQKHMFNLVKGTDNEQYIANPYGNFPGGFHNYGMAVDLSIADENGVPLNMGTGFDDFTNLAHVGIEYDLFSKGLLSFEAYSNRMLLYALTAASGLMPYPFEWWHYQLDLTEESKQHFILLDF